MATQHSSSLKQSNIIDFIIKNYKLYNSYSIHESFFFFIQCWIYFNHEEVWFSMSRLANDEQIIAWSQGRLK